MRDPQSSNGKQRCSKPLAVDFFKQVVFFFIPIPRSGPKDSTALPTLARPAFGVCHHQHPLCVCLGGPRAEHRWVCPWHSGAPWGTCIHLGDSQCLFPGQPLWSLLGGRANFSCFTGQQRKAHRGGILDHFSPQTITLSL